MPAEVFDGDAPHRLMVAFYRLGAWRKVKGVQRGLSGKEAEVLEKVDLRIAIERSTNYIFLKILKYLERKKYEVSRFV